MRAKTQLRDPFTYGSRRETLSAWVMAIVFATVAALSFIVDQTVILSPSEEVHGDAPSLLHPVQMIEMLLAGASK